jgi:asparagine synthase (glutamine-hydrolysing)
MCGIAGLVARDGAADAEAVRTMCKAMVHRGPDGEGLWADGPAALGHRRLSIIDLSEAGRQPMTNEDGSVVMVVNGELYNHEALRAKLERKGHVFRSRSDSEVVAHLWEEEGEATPSLLRGMFALAVWDRRKRKLLLARDRYGEKPLYWAMGPRGLAFASEISALLTMDELGRDVDLAALDAYLALQYVPNPWTIYGDIRKLPPGHQIVVGPGEEPAPRPYRVIDYTPAKMDEEEAIGEVRRAVEDAVRVRLMSDVPLGAFLSGGVDSSIVVACMARASSRPVKTFSIGFAERGQSELPYARLVGGRGATQHHHAIVSPPHEKDKTAIVRHHGEPFADPSAVPTRVLSEMTRRHVTVALSGDAGDESFGGYRRYVWAHVAEQIRRLPPPAARAVARVLQALPGGRMRWVREYGAHLGDDEATRYLRYVCHFSVGERHSVYAADLRARFARDATAERFAALLQASRGGDLVSRLMDLDVNTYLPDDILVKVDIASMAHSLEVRAPLVDHHVMELAASLPGALKIRGLSGKHVFKKAFEGDIPEAILRRSKKGFSLPLRRWFLGDLEDFARDVLLSARARQRGVFDPRGVEAMLDAHRRGEDHGDRIWNLLVLELWYRELVDGRAAFVQSVAAA